MELNVENFINSYYRFNHHWKVLNHATRQQGKFYAFFSLSQAKNMIDNLRKRTADQQGKIVQLNDSISKLLALYLCQKAQEERFLLNRCMEELKSAKNLILQLLFRTNQRILSNMWFQVAIKYNNLQNIGKVKMNSTYYEGHSLPKPLNFAFQIPVLGNYDFFFFPKSFSSELSFNLNQSSTYENLPQMMWKDTYESNTKQTIVLNSCEGKTDEISKFSENSCKGEKLPKPKAKLRQKQTRNIGSNLLRIFFKNLIELRFYDRKIEQIARQLKVTLTKEQFYQWIVSFGINFKNYIRVAQVNQIIKRDHPLHFRKIFVVLLHLYSRECGLLHCLTSKRIERSSLKMHLDGLKNLSKDLQRELQLQY